METRPNVAGVVARRALAILVAAALPLAAACGRGSHPVVVAASSLRTVLPDVARAHGAPPADLSFVGSQVAVAQVESGAPVDVVITAGREPMDRLREGGHVGEPMELGVARLALVVPAGNPADVRVPADLARPGLRVVLAAADVPAGRAARQVLAAGRIEVAGLAGAERSAAAVVSRVALGEADAGIAYMSDGAVPGVDVVPVTGAAPVPYLAAVVGGSEEGRRWLSALTTAAARADLDDALSGGGG